MTDKKTKTQKIDEALEKGHKIGDAVKEFTPPEIDNMIDRGEQAVKIGWGIGKLLKDLFRKK